MKKGTIIRILREHRGISQAELARELQVSRSTISMYESGARTPTSDMYENLADYFNVDLDYLMGRSDKTTMLPERLEYEKKKYENSLIGKAACIMQ